MTARLIPCLLLREGGLYKTVKFAQPKYVGDPINAVRILNDKEVDELLVLDIAAEQNGIDHQAVADLAGECFMPLCYGGGIRTVADAERLFELAVEKVSINTAAVEAPGIVAEAAAIFGSQSIVVSIDVRRRRRRTSVFIRNGTVDTGLDPVAHARAVEAAGAGEILLTSIDREGTGSGLDLDLIQAVSHAVSVPVVAHGGVGDLADVARGIAAGASGIAAGSMFVFRGRHRAVLISYPSPAERAAAAL